MKYFEYFPQFEYSERSATNVLVRAKVREYVLNNAAIYYKHRIEEGERPDTLSTKYYGNSNYTWLIFYSNDIYDPIFDWPLTNESLRAHLVNTLGSLQMAQQTPHHYLMDGEYIIDFATYTSLPDSRRTLVTVYEHYVAENEKRREIKLIDRVYALQITNEMRRLFYSNV